MVADNVVVLGFPDSSQAYEAYTKLNQLSAEGNVSVVGSMVVTRDADGALKVETGRDNDSGSGMTTGGIIGAIVGILGGPIGVLLGWGAGMATGSLFDLDKASNRLSFLNAASETITPGSTGLVAEVIEYTPSVIDELAESMGGTVARTSVDELETELDEAAQAQREAEKKQRKEDRDKKIDEFKNKVDKTVKDIRDKF